jgi:hypothetical protein
MQTGPRLTWGGTRPDAASAFGWLPAQHPAGAPDAAAEGDLADPMDSDADGDEPVQDPNRPRGWLVSEKVFDAIFRPEMGRFQDIPARRRTPRGVGQLFGC